VTSRASQSRPARVWLPVIDFISLCCLWGLLLLFFLGSSWQPDRSREPFLIWTVSLLST
jgi:hypothetical protein